MPNVVKTIENPEVPGLECLLPPPPPPPPPPIISEGAIADAAAAISANSDKVTDGASGKTVVPTVAVEVKIGSSESGESTSGAASGQTQSSPKPSSNAAKSLGSESTPLFPAALQAPYFVPPAAPPIPSGEAQPWWVPTDSDTADVVSANRTPWFDQSAAAWTDNSQKVVSPTSKAKGKFFKRKSECIDPAQDAERVANAQRELSALMKPLKCDLCNAIMNSTLQAKLHYDGKPHQKKVSMFLNQSVKKIKPDDGQVSSTTSSADWNTYCDVCKTWFTSQIDASQHYAGKKHIRATTGATKQKTKRQPQSQAPVDPTGRFGIGMPFSSEPQATILGSPELALATPVVAPPVLPPVTPTNYQASTWPFPAFRCELCGVTANRLEQLETHKRGAKHMKMMKMNGIAKSEVDEMNDSTTQPAPPTIDYSIYRTPSGQYYCAPCNRSFHSENSFAQHVESKKHKTQVNPKQAAPPPAASKKTNKSK